MLKGAFVLGENDFRKSFSPFSACLAVTENDFQLTNIFTFDPEMIFSPHFHFKAFSEKERERERERARARGEETEQLVQRSPADSELQATPISSSTIVAKIAIDGAILRCCEIAISPSTEIAINGAISRRVNREIPPSRARAASIARSRR